MIVWSGSFAELAAINASAPDPPDLLVGTSGRFAKPSLSTIPCIRRAILSAPPPLPAMMIKSIGLLGSQASALVVTKGDVKSKDTPRASDFNIFFIIFSLIRVIPHDLFLIRVLIVDR